MYIIMFVLDDPGQLDNVLDAWEDAGIKGVTIVESTGFQRRRIQRKKRIPMRFSFEPIMVGGESGNYTLFTFVNSEKMIEKCIHATELIVGNLNDPNTGVLAAWPLSVVKGIPDRPED
jgi:hypothetical protein